MLMHGEVAAFVYIGAQRAGEGEGRPEETQEGEGNPVADGPSVFGAGWADPEKLRRIPADKADAFLPAAAEADMEAAVGIDLEIEIPVFALRHEEKFQTAVLIDGRQGCREFRPDGFFLRLQMHVQVFRVMADPAEGADPEIRRPEDPVDLQLRNCLPIRFPGNRYDPVIVHGFHNPFSALKPGDSVLSASIVLHTGSVVNREAFFYTRVRKNPCDSGGGMI